MPVSPGPNGAPAPLPAVTPTGMAPAGADRVGRASG